MKAVILAAGTSSRIRSVTRDLPKCLLRFGEGAILDYQIASLLAAEVDQIAVVVGHGRQHIVDHVQQRYAGAEIDFIVNPLFASTNNIYSLWLAREWLGDSSFLCLNADVLYHHQIVLPAVRTNSDISVIVDKEFRDETMKVIIADGAVRRMSKGIARAQSNGTYIGITKFSRGIATSLFAAIASHLSEGHHNQFFNVAVESLIADGIRVGYTTTQGLPWAEIDDPSDLEFARKHVYPRLIGPARLPLLPATSPPHTLVENQRAAPAG